MSNPLALIVDDEPDIRELLEITLGRMSIDTKTAEDLRTAQALLFKQPFDLCLTDMRLPDGNGIELVELIGKRFPNLPVAVITAHGNMESAVQALKAGAFDFVSKPVDLQMLRKLVGTALKLETRTPAKSLPEQAAAPSAVLHGRSQAMEQIRTLISKLARSQAPVYISGESGTGKELAARLIHQQGPRTDGEFVAINCGAIPQELMESEFFGHVKGSFTGANANKQGLFQAADGGTLFLDEVADLPLHMQVKLLRAIQERAVRPVGAQGEIPVDVRIISATHKDLGQMVHTGDFRQDLYFRLNVIELNIPPLRERREDIPILTDQIMSRIVERTGETKPKIDREALQQLINHPFPGNVRELENILERAMTLCEAGTIGKADLMLDSESTSDQVEIPNDVPLDTYLENIEREILVRTLKETRWNRTAAAEKLGINVRALRYKLSKLGLKDE